MKKSFILSALIILSLCLTACAVQDEWPEDYENIDWVEISRDQAIEIWKNYDTTTLRDCSITVWVKWIGLKPQKWTGGEVTGSSYEDAEGAYALAGIAPLTTNPEKEKDNAVFYMKRNDSSVVKIERPDSSKNDPEFRMNIYKDGWCVVEKWYREFSSYEFYFIEYEGY